MQPPAGQTGLTASWTMEGNGFFINANITRTTYKQPPPGTGFISDSNINWVKADGTMYSVSGYSKEKGAGPGRDVLEAIAKSMDPDFDASKLNDGGGTVPVPAT